MFVLHVDLVVKVGSRQDLEAAYENVFYPAISDQAGFQAAGLLRPGEEGNSYRLTIAFINQELQRQWVTTALHQEVWPQIEKHCSRFSVNYYTAV